jgi:hypothetical protein
VGRDERVKLELQKVVDLVRSVQVCTPLAGLAMILFRYIGDYKKAVTSASDR